jgi:hypothetical protein
MPISSKLGFTKAHYTLKPTSDVVNYDPNAVVGDGSMGQSGGVTTSAGSYGGKK